MKVEQKQEEITLFLLMNGKFVNKNDFKSQKSVVWIAGRVSKKKDFFKFKTFKKVWPQRKTAIFLYYFLSFSVEIWNNLQQVEFFAQYGPWVF